MVVASAVVICVLSMQLYGDKWTTLSYQPHWPNPRWTQASKSKKPESGEEHCISKENATSQGPVSFYQDIFVSEEEVKMQLEEKA